MVLKNPLSTLLLFIMASGAALGQTSESQQVFEHVKQLDAIFTRGTYQYTGVFTVGSEIGSKIKSVTVQYNNAREYCIWAMKPDNLCTECYYKGTEFSYTKRDEDLRLTKNPQPYYGLNFPLWGDDHVGPCLILGRGLSAMDSLIVEKRNGNLLTFSSHTPSSEVPEIRVTGTLDARNHYLLKDAKVFLNDKLTVEWNCQATAQVGDASICTQGTLKRYNKGSLVEEKTTTIEKFAFGVPQKIDLLNSVPHKTLLDDRFETSVFYDDLPKSIDLETLTATSKQRAREQLMAEDQARDDNHRQNQKILLAYVVFGLLIGVYLLCNRRR